MAKRRGEVSAQVRLSRCWSGRSERTNSRGAGRGIAVVGCGTKWKVAVVLTGRWFSGAMDCKDAMPGRGGGMVAKVDLVAP